MFISDEEFLFSALSLVERKDLVHDAEHGGGRVAGHVGGRYQRTIRRASLVRKSAGVSSGRRRRTQEAVFGRTAGRRACALSGSDRNGTRNNNENKLEKCGRMHVER
jgi:hypothetical protein